jgi:hypothetical protein
VGRIVGYVASRPARRSLELLDWDGSRRLECAGETSHVCECGRRGRHLRVVRRRSRRVSAFANTYRTRCWTCGAVCSRPGGVWNGSAFRLDGEAWVRRRFRLMLFPPRAYLVRMDVRTKRKRSVCRCLRACRCCAWFHALRAAVRRKRRCWLMFILGCIFRHHLAPQT